MNEITEQEMSDWWELYQSEPWGEKAIQASLAIGFSATAWGKITPEQLMPKWGSQLQDVTYAEWKAYHERRKSGRE